MHVKFKTTHLYMVTNNICRKAQKHGLLLLESERKAWGRGKIQRALSIMFYLFLYIKEIMEQSFFFFYFELCFLKNRERSIW